MGKRFLLLNVVFATLAALSTPGLATYPDKPIRPIDTPALP